MNIARFAAVLAVCALVRVYIVSHDETFSRDGVTYLQMARQWSADPAGVVRDYRYHVGYPVAVWAAHRALAWGGARDDNAAWELAALSVSLVASLLAMAALWWLACLAFDNRIAWMTVLLFGLGRKWASLGADVLSDSLAVCLQLWGVVLALLALRALRRARWLALGPAAGAGLCAGAGYLVRPEALAIAPLAAGLWVFYALRRLANRPQAAAAVATALLAAAACALPYMLAIGGISKKKALDDFVQAPSATAAPLAQAFQAAALPPHKFADRLINAAHPVLGVGICLYVAAWLVLRFVRTERLARARTLLPRPEAAAAGLMAATAILFAVVLMPMYVRVQYLSHRHVMFLAALLSPLGAAAIVFLTALPARALQRRLPVLAPHLGALAVIVLAGVLAWNTCSAMDDDGPAVRAAGAALAARVAPGDRVFTDDLRVTYYAGVRGERLPPRDRAPDQIDDWIAHARYVVLSRRSYGSPDGPVAARLARPPFRRIWPTSAPAAPADRAVHLYWIEPPRTPR